VTDRVRVSKTGSHDKRASVPASLQPLTGTTGDSADVVKNAQIPWVDAGDLRA